jgi:transcriptional regulator with XRE-family HTH domain
MVNARPAWARRIRAEREARGWSQADTVRALRAHGDQQTPGQESLLRQWKRWESGDVEPDGRYKPLIARTFGTATAVIFPPEHGAADAELLAASGMDTLELVARLRGSDISDATLDGLSVVVDKLGVDYSREPADQLRAEGLEWLRRVTAMLDRRLTLKQHREVLSLAGRVALLVGCVEADMGLRGPAEATRQAAMSLGEESDDKDVIGWAWEMAAWFSLTQGEYRAAVAATSAGLAAVGPGHSVVVQLDAHRAKAWARMRDRREVEVALNEGRQVLDALPYPHNVANHFVVDPSKWDFYTQDAYRHVGDDDLARMYAEEVIRTGTDWDGTVLRPMRVAEAEITLGVLAARAGDLEAAVGAGRRALSLGRRSLPSLAMNARELTAEIQRRFPDAPPGAEFADELRTALAA